MELDRDAKVLSSSRTAGLSGRPSAIEIEHLGPSSIEIEHLGPSSIEIEHLGPSSIEIAHLGPSSIEIEHLHLPVLSSVEIEPLRILTNLAALISTNLAALISTEIEQLIPPG